MVEFLRKSETRGDKIARVNSIRIIKSINLFPSVRVLQWGPFPDSTFHRIFSRPLSIHADTLRCSTLFTGFFRRNRLKQHLTTTVNVIFVPAISYKSTDKYLNLPLIPDNNR